MAETSGTAGRDARVIVLAGGLILALSFGVRATFGGVLEPLSSELFGGRIEIFSLSIAIQNLVWGIAQPAFGLLADRYGDRRALWLGLACYLLGMAVCITGESASAQHLGAGVLVGMGISGTAFGVVLAVVGRASPVNKRSQYLAVTSAIGSAGQALLPLLVSWLAAWLDWRTTLMVMGGLLLLMAICIPLIRPRGADFAEGEGGLDAAALIQALTGAWRDPNYRLLIAGFSVCGFHLSFITAHLPTYLQHFCLSPASAADLRALGLQALALAGFANIFGTLYVARLGARYSKPRLLAAIFGLRSVVMLVFMLLPLTPVSVSIFASVMGVLWLSTVPLTSALVLERSGPAAFGTLFGFVFLGHQVGGFLGVWLGGVAFDRFADYDAVWSLSILLGLLAALAHLCMKEPSAERPAQPGMLRPEP